jgi:deazaflavin-dependent oxidoreductase (nitroreductase family)
MTGDPEPAFAYLTTSGRISGEPHRVELWFVVHEGTLYLLAGGGTRSDWVRNLLASPRVVVEVGDRRRTTRARFVTAPDEDALARRLMLEKYAPQYAGDLTSWGRTATPVAVAWDRPDPTRRSGGQPRSRTTARP